MLTFLRAAPYMTLFALHKDVLFHWERERLRVYVREKEEKRNGVIEIEIEI